MIINCPMAVMAVLTKKSKSEMLRICSLLLLHRAVSEICRTVGLVSLQMAETHRSNILAVFEHFPDPVKLVRLVLLQPLFGVFV